MPVSQKRLERALFIDQDARIFSHTSAFFAIFAVAIWSNVSNLTADQFTTKNGVLIQNFRVYDASRDIIHFLLPALILHGLVTASNIGQCDRDLYPTCGPKYALVPLFLSIFLPLAFYMIAISLPLTFDFKYNFALYYSLLLYIILFMVLDIYIRTKWSNMDVKPSSIQKFTDGANDTQTRDAYVVEHDDNGQHIRQAIIRNSAVLLNVVFTISYVLYIHPVYFSASTVTRG